MTRNSWMENPEAVREAKKTYAFIGEYVICFQWLEGKIDEIFLLARGHDCREETFHWLAQKTNAQKIDEFHELVTSGEPFRTASLQGWNARLRSVVDKLHAERRRRNGILHAQFLFDFLAIGEPVIRTHVRRQSGEVTFDQEDLSPQKCKNIMEEIALLSLELNMICVQLYQLYEAPNSV